MKLSKSSIIWFVGAVVIVASVFGGFIWGADYEYRQENRTNFLAPGMSTQIDELAIGRPCNPASAYTIADTKGLQCYGYGDPQKGEPRQGVWMKPDSAYYGPIGTNFIFINKPIIWKTYTINNGGHKITFPYPADQVKVVAEKESPGNLTLSVGKFDILNIQYSKATVAEAKDRMPDVKSPMVTKEDFYGKTKGEVYREFGKDNGASAVTYRYLFYTDDGYAVWVSDLSRELGFTDTSFQYVSAYIINNLEIK